MSVAILLIKAVMVATVCFAAVLGATAMMSETSVASDVAMCAAAPMKACLVSIF